MTRDQAKSFLENQGARDLPVIVELFDDDIDGLFRMRPSCLRPVRGLTRALFQDMWSALERGKRRIQPGKLLIDGNDAVVLSQFSHVAKATGKRFTPAVATHLAAK